MDRKARKRAYEVLAIFADGLSINPGVPLSPSLSLIPLFCFTHSQRRERTRIKEPPRKSDFLSRCRSCRRFLRTGLLKNDHGSISLRPSTLSSLFLRRSRALFSVMLLRAWLLFSFWRSRQSEITSRRSEWWNYAASQSYPLHCLTRCIKSDRIAYIAEIRLEKIILNKGTS